MDSAIGVSAIRDSSQIIYENYGLISKNPNSQVITLMYHNTIFTRVFFLLITLVYCFSQSGNHFPIYPEVRLADVNRIADLSILRFVVKEKTIIRISL